MHDLDQLLKIQHGERNLKFGVNNLRKKKNLLCLNSTSIAVIDYLIKTLSMAQIILKYRQNAA